MKLKQQEIAQKISGGEEGVKGTKHNSVNCEKATGKTITRKRSPNKIADKLKMMAELAASSGDNNSADTNDDQVLCIIV